LGFARSKSGTLFLLASLLAVADRLQAADPLLPVTGNLLGSVVDASGIPQMGASVQLFNKYERLLAKTSTSGDGRFAFADLPIDTYSIRVSLPSFLPASRDRIPVKAGRDSLLQIHLTTLLSSIEVKYVSPTSTMSEDWKWVLRSSPATRPITRWMPLETAKTSHREGRTRIFSDTRAVVSLSGGDNGIIDSDYAPSDLGTGFALSTNILGNNQLRVSGTYGAGNGINPGAVSLSAFYTNTSDSNGYAGFVGSPEVSFSVSQWSFAEGQNVAGSVGGGSLPQVRTMSVSVYQTLDPTANIHVEYGATGESLDYIQHRSRLSPFARITGDLGRAGKVVAVYSDGSRPDPLIAHQAHSGSLPEQAVGTDLERTMSASPGAVARVPQLSYRNDRLELQRTQNYELGYDKAVGSRTYSVSAFYEQVANGRLNVAGDASALDAGDLLSDGVSTTSIYNVGRYNRSGYLASAEQRVSDNLDVALAYGRLGGFTVGDSVPASNRVSGNRFLNKEGHNTAAVDVKAKVPGAGTRLLVNYGWVDGNAVIPRHVFTSQDVSAQPGFNILVRQPLPPMFGMGGHFELTADLYNLLAQGYLPVSNGDGGKLIIVQAPRALRGGLKFVF
jgi:Carboxypeptidase regulatory-like domain